MRTRRGDHWRAPQAKRPSCLTSRHEAVLHLKNDSCPAHHVRRDSRARRRVCEPQLGQAA